MSKIVVKKQVGRHFDALDGEKLKDKELIQIKWPDKSLETIALHVVVRHPKVSMRHAEAYFVTKYRGRDTWVRLLGLEAKRV